MYYMVLVVGGNETAPSNVVLKFYSAAAIFIGNIYMANIMGSMANYVSFQEEMMHSRKNLTLQIL